MYIDWIKAGLSQPGKSGKGLAGHLKRSESVVSRILSGERQIKADELPRIADYLGTEIPLGGSVRNGANYANTTQRRSALATAQSVRLVSVMAVIAPAVWREAGSAGVSSRTQVPAVPDQRLSGLEQYACEIEAEPGHFAICVNYFELRQRPVADDLVHVIRTRGDLRENTLRRVAIHGDQVRLQLAGEGGKGAAGALSYPSRKPTENLEIKGLVVGHFHAERF
jgi:plasmid maintenance system antidote protein VapI